VEDSKDMPTYQYVCTDGGCGATFERVQSFTEPAVSECPECAQPVRKVYSSVGVVFKGSGFYRTDSRAAEASSNGRAKDAADGKGTPSKDAAGGNDAGGGKDGVDKAKTSDSASTASGNGAAKTDGASNSSGGASRSSTAKASAG
jgi:putative FmdB family regulatory protein